MYKVEKMLLKVSEVAFNIEADKAMAESQSIRFHYNPDGTVALFSIVDDSKDVGKITEKIKKYTEDFTKVKYNKHIEYTQVDCDVLNGLKQKPIVSIEDGLR